MVDEPRTFGAFVKGGRTRVAHTPAEAVSLRFEGWTSDAPAPAQLEAPPRGGAGSGVEAWAAYAAAAAVPVDADATREDIIAALDAAGVPTGAGDGPPQRGTGPARHE